MSGIKRENHYVPQFYLRSWSMEGNKVWAYPLLVPTGAEARWRERSISSIARLTDFYTSSIAGYDSDEIENWLNEEFEVAAAPTIRKLTAGKELTVAEWNALIRFAGMLSRRTIAAYLKVKRRAEEIGPRLLQETLKRAVHKLENAAAKGKRAQTLAVPEGQVGKFPLTVSVEPDEHTGGGFVKATFTPGREYFLWTLRNVAVNRLDVLQRHRWTVLQPARGMEWFTSDNPFIALNYTRPGEYDFGGGWGRKNGDLILPLGPHHLLHAQVGKRDFPTVRTLSREKTFEMQKLIAEHAHRSIFARAPITRVAWFRKTHISVEAYQAELRGFREWHHRQVTALRDG